MSRRCIFCGRIERDFDGKNSWSNEHIIPESLGNSTLVIKNVCKQCNSRLGTYVDNYLVNHSLIMSYRQFLKLPSKKGVIPNAFREGVTEDGTKIRLSRDFVPSVVPAATQEGSGKLKIVASSVGEARAIAKKKLERQNIPLEQINCLISKIDSSCLKTIRPDIQFDITLDINRFLLESLKIGYEYASLKFGDAYLDDPTAVNIRKQLFRAISGEMCCTCEKPPEANLFPLQKGQDLDGSPVIHALFIASTLDNKLIAYIFLFFSPIFSYQVLLSLQADRYLENGECLCDFIESPSI